MRMKKWTPSTKRYFTPSRDKSLCRQRSTDSLNSVFAWLISVWEIVLPNKWWESNDKLRVLIPVRNIKDKSRVTAPSYCLLRGKTWVRN